MNTRTSITIPLEGKEFRFSISSLSKLVKFQYELLHNYTHNEILIDISKVRYISPAFTPIIFSLPNYDKKFKIMYNVNNENLMNQMEKIGVLRYFKVSKRKFENKAIEFSRVNSESDALDIAIKAMDLAQIETSSDAKTYLLSNLYEILNNSLLHGENNIGTFVNGYLHPSKKYFIFSVYDYGVGIKRKVNDYLANNLTSQQSLEWALTAGNSTLKSDYPRGAGFSKLLNFISANKGQIFLCSSNIAANITNDIKYEEINNALEGTLFIIKINEDKIHKYIVAR